MAVPAISRRRVLALAGLGAAATAAGVTGWVLRAAGPGTITRPGISSGRALSEPKILSSHNGVLDVRLAAAPGVVLAGRATSAWGYNGTSPGPTLRLRPGDLLRVRLVNQLPEATNLHTHGLHVSPQGAGDNPFVSVEPGSSFDYAIRIPADHPAGTFWYHPHHHGHVADQIFAGLSGALIVDDGIDLGVHADRILLVTDTTLDDAGRVVAPTRTMTGREGDLVLVNGEHQPVMRTRPGATERWRVINGCTSRVLALRLDGPSLSQIAVDGIYLPTPVDAGPIVLAPGNRADLLVTPSDRGTWRLISDSHRRGTTMMGAGRRPAGPVVLATLTAGGAPVTAAPAPVLPMVVAARGTVTGHRRLTLHMGMGAMMGGAMAFTIDGRTFDPTRDDQTVALGSVEEWTVVNTTTVDHPFHLHAWPFEVVGLSSGRTVAGARQDVVLVPAGGWARLKIAFTDFTGRTVYHCHVLDHEDRGMMGVVDVVA